ncbi:hypothetical protein Noda2021_12750 [Candidatus Dependentiae bacterium Noda2021]|nr:hypothetical protein Noda2021_12750 [Candidatus Dependentiae bacterium Noda2021]
MKKIIFMCLLFSRVAVGYNSVNSWINYNLFPDTIRIKDKKRAPDQNSYKWLKYIYEKSGDICLNTHIVENSNFYKAIIKKNTHQTNKTLKQYFRLTSKLFLSGICYCAGMGILYLLHYELSQPPTKKNLQRKADVQAEIFSLLTATGLCFTVGSYIIYKTIKKRLKLKKTLKRNAKMLHALESVT